MAKKQAHIMYTGMVQGVGFRYSVQEIAEAAGLCGWVKNLSDGRVEAVYEGEKLQIEKCLADVRSALSNYIRDEKCSWFDPTGQWDDFKVTFF